MKKKNQGAKKLNNKKLGTRDGTLYNYSRVWDTSIRFFLLIQHGRILLQRCICWTIILQMP